MRPTGPYLMWFEITGKRNRHGPQACLRPSCSRCAPSPRPDRCRGCRASRRQHGEHIFLGAGPDPSARRQSDSFVQGVETSDQGHERTRRCLIPVDVEGRASRPSRLNLPGGPIFPATQARDAIRGVLASVARRDLRRSRQREHDRRRLGHALIVREPSRADVACNDCRGRRAGHRAHERADRREAAATPPPPHTLPAARRCRPGCGRRRRCRRA